MFGTGSIALAVDDGQHPRSADAGTLTGWEDQFGESITTTKNAGRVWVDKSVADGDVSLYRDGQTWGNPLLTVERSDVNNFLVGLSAISSSKSIVGQDTIPIDVMLVLDVSGSMNGSDGNSNSVDDLVASTNDAITQLLALNINNRVGVVLFSGNADFGDSTTSTATVLLPLGRYTAGNDSRFITYMEGHYDTWTGEWIPEEIYLQDGIRTEEGGWVSQKSKNVEGGTYIQNGLYQAWEELRDADNKTVDGANKIPVMVLMGDGAPTAATTSYSSVRGSDFGDGYQSGYNYAFANQLTAAWIRNQMQEAYGREPLFYTLGLGLDNLDNKEEKGYHKTSASMTLNPSENTNPDLDTYWNRFDRLAVGSSGTFGGWYRYSSGWGGSRLEWAGNVNITKADDTISSADRYYVDEYFSARNPEELGNAFQSIIEEIYIQSMYYPTDVSGNNSSLSGYLTFEDTIGQYMQVKKINGLTYKDELYTGKNFARTIQEAESWRPGEEAEEYYDEVVRSIVDRLDITPQQAQNLIDTAYRDGQLYYQSEYDFNNSVKWYAKADGSYIGPWRSTDTSAPQEAAYINESYLFSGDYTTEVGAGVTLTTDLMYITVRVSTDIATGQQKVTFSVPASLIPQVKYKITIQGNSLDDADEAISVERTEAYPMRLFYEVGAAATADNIALMAGKDYAYYNEADDTYTLYTNAWTTDGSGKKVAQTKVSFDPSQENEFYYYHRDTTIRNADGSVYKGRTEPTTGYYQKEVFTVGRYTDIDRRQLPISEAALEKAQYDRETNTWYIPKGTPKRQENIKTVDKGQNTTDTAGYVLEPVLQPNMDNPGHFHIEANLGNNGLLTIRPNYGNLKVEKSVGGNRGQMNRDFSFTLTFTNPYRDNAPVTGTYSYQKTVSGQATPVTGQITLDQNGQTTLTLKHGENITILGLPTETDFKVQEADPNTSGEDYVTTVKVNGVEVSEGTTDRLGTGDIRPPTGNGTPSEQLVSFLNTWIAQTSPFSFIKADGTAGADSAPLQGAEFKLYRLDCSQLGDEGHSHLTEPIDPDDPGDCWTFVDDGISAEDGQVTLEDLASGTYRLVETKAPSGFQLPSGQWNVEVNISAMSEKDQFTIEAIDTAKTPAFEWVTEQNTYRVYNYKPVEIPITGGQGWTTFLLAGTLLMIGGGLLCCVRYRSRQQG